MQTPSLSVPAREGRFRAAAELHPLSGRSTQISRFGLGDGDPGGHRWPLCWVLLSRRDVAGSLAAAAVAAGLAARVFRVCEARCVLSMISASHGNIRLAYALRGLP